MATFVTTFSAPPSSSSVATNATNNSGGSMDTQTGLFSMQYNPSQMINSIVSGAQNQNPYFNFFQGTSSQIMNNFQNSQAQAYSYATAAQKNVNSTFLPLFNNLTNTVGNISQQYANATNTAAQNTQVAKF